MEYELEISFKLKLGATYSYLKNKLQFIFEKNNITNYYFTTELEGEGKKISTSLVIVFITTTELISLNNLITDIKKHKEYNIDCIYHNNKIFYASSYYLTQS